MPKLTGGIYKVVGVAIIVVGIIATICYCRTEVKLSSEYLENSIEFPSLYSLEDATSEDYEYPVAKGIVISVLCLSLGTIVYGVGDIVDKIGSQKTE